MLPNSEESIQQLIRYGHKLPPSTISAVFPAAIKKVVQRSLSLLIGSEELARDLFARRSVDCIAAKFDIVIPATYQGENLQRAIILAGGEASEVQRELLKIMIFLASNHLFLDRSPFILKKYAEDVRTIVSLCRLTGFANWPMIRDLVRLSRSSSTITATVDMLFEASVNAGAGDMVDYLLRADERIHADRGVLDTRELHKPSYGSFSNYPPSRVTPLASAVFLNSVELATVLMEHHANINYTTIVGCEETINVSLLSLAILIRQPNDCDDMVQFLLRKGASINLAVFNKPPDHLRRVSPLQAAFMAGDRATINQLVNAGADINYVCSASVFSWPMSFLPVIRHIKGVDCLGFAASFCARGIINYSPTAKEISNEVENTSNDEEMALSLCRELAEKFNHIYEISATAKANALVLAASMGYSKVLSYLHCNIPVNYKPENGYLFSPLCAAVYYKRFDTCRLLLDMDLSLNVNERYPGNIPVTGVNIRLVNPHLLHIATCRRTYDLVRILIKNGAEVNNPCKVYRYSPNVMKLPNSYGRSRVIALSPLGLAICLDSWDISSLLIELGAVPTTNDLLAVTERGNLTLVQQMIQVNMHPNGIINAYQLALSCGKVEIAAYFHSAGITIREDELALFFRLKTIQEISALLPQHRLQNPASISPDKSGRSYLENAIMSGERDVISFALSLDPQSYDSGSMCAAVHLAMNSSLPDEDSVLSELLRRRDQQEYSSMNPVLENTAIVFALLCGRTSIVTQLLKNYQGLLCGYSAVATSTIRNPVYCLSAIEEFLRPFWFHTQGYHAILADNWHDSNVSVSPLLFAACGYSGDETAIENLLKAGYQADGLTLVAVLFQRLRFADKGIPIIPFHIVQRLVQTCNDVDALCLNNLDLESDYYVTPLYLATEAGDLDTIRLLIAHGADVNLIKSQDVLMAADEAGPKALQSCLLSCLSMATMHGNLSAVVILLDHGANINSPPCLSLKPTPATMSALECAAQKGYIGIAKYLLSRGADVNARRAGPFGRTALEAAAECGRIDMVQLLLVSGVSTTGHGAVQYVRAIQAAKANGHGAVVELLESQRAWTPADQAIKDDFRTTEFSMHHFFLHPKEFYLSELIDWVARMDKSFIKREMMKFSPWKPCMWKKRTAIAIQQWIEQWIDDVATYNPDTEGSVLHTAVRVVTNSIREHSSMNDLPKQQVGLIASEALQKLGQHLQTQNESLNVDGLELTHPSIYQGWDWDDGIADSFLMMQLDEDFHSESGRTRCSSFTNASASTSLIFLEGGFEYSDNISCENSDGDLGDHGLRVNTVRRNENGVFEIDEGASALERAGDPGTRWYEEQGSEDLEQQRIVAFRDEMEGKGEAPFIPIEWQW